MQYEMLLGGTATPLESWTLMSNQVALHDIDPSQRNQFTVLGPAILGSMQRQSFIDAMCTMPAGGCESTVRDLMRALMTSVLAVVKPLREFVLQRGNEVWGAGRRKPPKA